MHQIHGIRYHPCEDQRAMAEMFAVSLKGLLPLARLHHDDCEDPEAWAGLESIGLFAIGVAETVGGAGLGAAEEALIAMELGRCLVSPSVLATIGVAHAATGAVPRGTRVAVAWRRDGRTVLVKDPHARMVLLRDGERSAVHAMPTDSTTLDGVLWRARLGTWEPREPPLAEFDAAGLLRLRMVDAAALAGIAALAVEQAVAYAGERRQFGRLVGSFQAVKHHCANMAIAARNACDQVGFAAVAVDQGREDASFQVDCALVVAGNAALRNAAMNIQVHGGMGFSDEALPHVLLKRARVLLAAAGGREAALDRIAAASHAAGRDPSYLHVTASHP